MPIPLAVPNNALQLHIKMSQMWPNNTKCVQRPTSENITPNGYMFIYTACGYKSTTAVVSRGGIYKSYISLNLQIFSVCNYLLLFIYTKNKK